MTSPLREIFARFGVEVDTRPLQKLEHAVDDAKAGLTSLAKETTKSFSDVIADLGNLSNTLSFFGPIVGDLVTSMTENASVVTRLAGKLSITTDEMQRLQLVAATSGIDLDNMSDALREMQIAAVDASDANSEQGKAFRELGVNVRGANGQVKPTMTLFRELAVALNRVQDPAKRTALADKVLGDSSEELFHALGVIPGALDSAGASLDELGGSVSGDNLAAMRTLSNAFAEIKIGATALATKALALVTPTVSKVISSAKKLAPILTGIIKSQRLLQVAAAMLTVVLARQLVIILLQNTALLRQLMLWGLYLAAFIVIAIAVEDLWTTIEGGKSVTRDLIDSIFGIGATQGAIEGVVDDFRLWSHWLSQAYGYLSNIVDILSPLIRLMLYLNRYTLFGLAARGLGITGEGGSGQRSARPVEQPSESRTERGGPGAGAITESRSSPLNALRPIETSLRVFRSGIARGREAPSRQSPAVSVGGGTVNVNIQTVAQDPEEVGRVVRRETREELSRQRRQTLAALTPSTSR